MQKYKDIIGQRFGKLVAINRSGRTDKRVQLIKCKCDCGNEIIVRYPNLVSGTTKSCGCVKRQNTSKRKTKNLIGQKFGKLLVIDRYSPIGEYPIKWMCLYDCGHTTIARAGNLSSGITKSCGCMRSSRSEKIISKILDACGVKYKREIVYNDLLSKNGIPLRFDFQIFDQDDNYFLLEYQGVQHYIEQPNGFGDYERLFSDKMKKEYCLNNNIELVEITYEEDLIESLNKILYKHNLLHDNTVPSSN